MAQQKFKEWLDKKVKKRKESVLTEQEKYEEQKINESDNGKKLSFEQWKEQKEGFYKNCCCQKYCVFTDFFYDFYRQF
jgi:hypothetical protein